MESTNAPACWILFVKPYRRITQHVAKYFAKEPGGILQDAQDRYKQVADCDPDK